MDEKEVKRFKPILTLRKPLVILLILPWISVLGCVADQKDALIMKDENLYQDLIRHANTEEERTKKSRTMGENLWNWSQKFESNESITLAECFRLALVRSEDLLLQGERLFETWTYEKEAISSLLPSAGFNWFHTRDSQAIKFAGQTISPRKGTEYNFAVQQKIFDGRSLAAVPAAREARRIERLTLKDNRDRLLYSVAATFYKILGLEHDVQVLEASLESAEEFFRVVEAQWKSGEASRQNAYIAEAQQEEAKSQLIQARHEVRIARTDLARIIGLTHLPETLVDTYEVALSPGLIPSLAETALEKRADLEAAQARVEFAKAERLAEVSDYLPVITADFTRWLKREGAFSSDIDWNFSLNLFWNLFDSGGREYRQARALSKIRQRELELSALERQVRFEVKEAVLFFDALNSVLKALKSRAYASRISHELANAEYKADEATNLDVVVARRTWEEAERDLIRAELARKLSALKIRLVMGDFKVAEPLLEAVEIARE